MRISYVLTFIKFWKRFLCIFHIISLITQIISINENYDEYEPSNMEDIRCQTLSQYMFSKLNWTIKKCIPLVQNKKIHYRKNINFALCIYFNKTFILHKAITMRSERSDESNFRIKCIYNVNFFNRKTIKYSQMHTIHIFIHIFAYIYSNCSKWPPSGSIQRVARFLLCRTIFLKAPSSKFSANLLTPRWRSHMFLGFTFFKYCVHWLKRNSPVVKSLANMVANDTACCERWFDLQISFAKMTNIVRQRDNLLHHVETNIISLLRHA